MGLRIRIRLKPPKIHLPTIPLPKLPKLPKLPDPFEEAKNALEGARKVTDEAVSHARKAIDDTLKLPTKVGAELERDLDRISGGLADTRKRVVREAGGALRLIADAANAAAKFTERETKGSVETMKGALHRRNVVSSVWYLATTPIKTTNKNAMQATRDSAVLAVAAQVAATAYGGPAGAAAYAAWTAYNLTGGDINAALRAGVTQGLIAAATGAVANMPTGAEKVLAETALKSAIAKAQGANSEEIAQVALASLVQAGTAQLTMSLNEAQLGEVQKGIVSGALGGAAVAASGGNSEAIREAFLKSGGEVLVQGVRAQVNEIADAAKDSATEFLTSAIEKEDLAAATRAYEEVKANVESAEAIVAEGKRSLESIVATARQASAEADAQIMKTRASLQAQVDAAKARVLQAREEVEERTKAVQETAITAYGVIKSESDKEIAAGKKSAEEIKVYADGKIRELNDATNEVLARTNREQAEVMAEADRVASEGLRQLEATRASEMDELLRMDGGTSARALSNDWIVSWDPRKLGTAAGGGLAVVLTYAGAGSQADRQIDAVENPGEEP